MPICAVGAITAVGWIPGAYAGGLVKEIDGARKGQVWILAAQHAAGDGREVLGDDDSGSRRGFGHGRVLGIGDKGNVPGIGFFDAGDSGDVSVAIRVFERGAEGGGDSGKFHDVRKPMTSVEKRSLVGLKSCS